MRALDLILAKIRGFVEVGAVQILNVDMLTKASTSVEGDEAGVVLQVAEQK